MHILFLCSFLPLICCWGTLQDAEMQHLLPDSENCSVSLSSSTGEGRHGTSAISFLGALRIPVSACAAPLKNEILPQNSYFREVLGEAIVDINFASCGGLWA